MRVNITGGRSLIDKLQNEFPKQNVEIIETKPANDKTQQAFSAEELFTIIASVKSIADMIKVLLEVSSGLKKTKKTISITTANGPAPVELSEETTEQYLVEKLDPILK